MFLVQTSDVSLLKSIFSSCLDDSYIEFSHSCRPFKRSNCLFWNSYYTETSESSSALTKKLCVDHKYNITWRIFYWFEFLRKIIINLGCLDSYVFPEEQKIIEDLLSGPTGIIRWNSRCGKCKYINNSTLYLRLDFHKVLTRAQCYLKYE